MNKNTGSRYTQKTLQTPPASSSSPAEMKGKMAGPKEEDLPISVRTLRNELQTYRDGMMKDIKTQITDMHQEIRKDISILRDEAKADINMLRTELSRKIETLHKTHTETANTQKEMEKSLCDTSDRIMQLEKTAETLSNDYKKLQEKCMDLENRSRRQNLRIIGISEGIEAGNPSRFMAEFFTEVFGEENFDSPIIIDRAHRTLAPKPRKGDRPRAMVVRLHYYSDKEKILKLSRNKGRVMYGGSPVHIFPDTSPEVGRLRASFNQVKVKLRNAGVPYSLFYPARLVITADGSRHSFTDPQEAEKFLNSNNLTATED